jgi:hypothetical protein
MNRREDTIELPKLRRARGGWVLYGPNEDSICPVHQFCAYSGDERGLCELCHGSHPTDEHDELPPGRLAPCLCRKCGELFKSVTGFNMHFGRAYKCRNPAKRGLITIEQTDRDGYVWTLWAKPGSRPEDV